MPVICDNVTYGLFGPVSVYFLTKMAIYGYFSWRTAIGIIGIFGGFSPILAFCLALTGKLGIDGAPFGQHPENDALAARKTCFQAKNPANWSRSSRRTRGGRPRAPSRRAWRRGPPPPM
jgi:hypothetical protein